LAATRARCRRTDGDRSGPRPSSTRHRRRRCAAYDTRFAGEHPVRWPRVDRQLGAGTLTNGTCSTR
jgi:hypothetical protein